MPRMQTVFIEYVDDYTGQALFKSSMRTKH